MGMVLYSGTTRPGHEVKLDFFLMHILTSAMFLPFFVNNLSLAQSARLLKAHFATAVVVYIACNRPQIYLENVYSYKSELDFNDEVSNPWLKVIERTIAHEDTHLVKAIRALMYGEIYLTNCKEGDQRAPERKELTSRYWLNSAKMTLDCLRDGRWWEHDCIGFDEVWQRKSVMPTFIE